MEKRNISVSSKNGYTLEKVMKAKEYLDEIGRNKRAFPFERLVEMYNDVYDKRESATGCKCQSPKFYNGLNNFYKFGKLTLINSGAATEEDFVQTPVEAAVENFENRVQGVEPVENEAPRKKGRTKKVQDDRAED